MISQKTGWVQCGVTGRPRSRAAKGEAKRSACGRPLRSHLSQ
jgi:hypothetical protein